MKKKIMVLVAAFMISPAVFAKSELVAQTKGKTALAQFQAELYYDRETKKSDLWFDYLQGTTPEDRIAFKATSLQERFGEAEYRLVPQPLTRLEGRTTLIFDGHDQKTGGYNPNRGLVLIYHFPLSELAEQTIAQFQKTYPAAIVKDAANKPLYLKALLCRITEYQVYPIAAFDFEPGP